MSVTALARAPPCSSGAMYDGVPAVVVLNRVASAFIRRAMPKSAR